MKRRIAELAVIAALASVITMVYIDGSKSYRNRQALREGLVALKEQATTLEVASHVLFNIEVFTNEYLTNGWHITLTNGHGFWQTNAEGFSKWGAPEMLKPNEPFTLGWRQVQYRTNVVDGAVETRVVAEDGK